METCRSCAHALSVGLSLVGVKNNPAKIMAERALATENKRKALIYKRFKVLEVDSYEELRALREKELQLSEQVSIVCVLVGLGSVVLGTPWLRGRIVARLTAWRSRKNNKKAGRRKIVPVTASLSPVEELQSIRAKFGAGSDEYKAAVRGKTG